ncbi:hypothetical protein DDA71_01085 [Bifidobacterium longum subsp. longum]|nr:hypothetical protein [Bifidobacterium longum subsp. longum]
MRLDAPSHLLACCTVAMLLVSVSRTFQSDVVMCSTFQRTPSTSGAQLAFEPYQRAQCRAEHNAYGAVENDGQRKRGEHEDSPPEK